MKIFGSLQELWDYCKFCHICQDSTKAIDISFPSKPNTNPILDVKHYKHPNSIYISGSFKVNTHRYNGGINLDINNNTFAFDLQDFIHFVSSEFPPTLSIMMSGDCLKCDCSYCISTIKLDLATNSITKFGVLREGLHLLSEDDKFNLAINYQKNELEVSKYLNIDDQIVDDNHVIKMPLVPLDFTNIAKVVHRIKTMIIFS